MKLNFGNQLRNDFVVGFFSSQHMQGFTRQSENVLNLCRHVLHARQCHHVRLALLFRQADREVLALQDFRQVLEVHQQSYQLVGGQLGQVVQDCPTHKHPSVVI